MARPPAYAPSYALPAPSYQPHAYARRSRSNRRHSDMEPHGGYLPAGRGAHYVSQTSNGSGFTRVKSVLMKESRDWEDVPSLWSWGQHACLQQIQHSEFMTKWDKNLELEDMISTDDRNAWATFFARQGVKVIFSNGQLGMGTMRLGSLAKSLATDVNIRHRAKGLLPRLEHEVEQRGHVHQEEVDQRGDVREEDADLKVDDQEEGKGYVLSKVPDQPISTFYRSSSFGVRPYSNYQRRSQQQCRRLRAPGKTMAWRPKIRSSRELLLLSLELGAIAS